MNTNQTRQRQSRSKIHVVPIYSDDSEGVTYGAQIVDTLIVVPCFDGYWTFEGLDSGTRAEFVAGSSFIRGEERAFASRDRGEVIREAYKEAARRAFPSSSGLELIEFEEDRQTVIQEFVRWTGLPVEELCEEFENLPPCIPSRYRHLVEKKETEQ